MELLWLSISFDYSLQSLRIVCNSKVQLINVLISRLALFFVRIILHSLWRRVQFDPMHFFTHSIAPFHFRLPFYFVQYWCYGLLHLKEHLVSCISVLLAHILLFNQLWTIFVLLISIRFDFIGCNAVNSFDSFDSLLLGDCIMMMMMLIAPFRSCKSGRIIVWSIR